MSRQACLETVAQRPGQARVVMVLLVAKWFFFEPAATQSTACGSADSGCDAVSGDCEGLYAGAHSGFTTKCGDGHCRAGGCELAVDAAFKRHDADHDGTIDAQEARGMFRAIGIDAEAMGQKFEHVDVNGDGRLTIEEWEAAGNTHPTIAMRVTAADGFDERFPVESADFGAPFRQSEVSSQNGALSVASPIEACETLQGGAELYQDKIVLATRGTCEFCKKAKAAQAAGARAIMVANNDESLIHMTVGTCGGDVEIPSIMVPHSAGEKLKQLGQDTHVSFPVCPQGGDVVPGHGMETCDDGNMVSGDGCNSECVLECGNKVIDGQETCDDGNTIDGDGCSSLCSLEPGFVECSPIGCTSSCGDGIAIGRPDSCDSAVTFSFSRNDEDGDGKLNSVEAQGVFTATGVDSALFEEIDANSDGKLSLEEWEKGENVHPPLAVLLTTFSGITEYHPMETADFGADFRHTGEGYSGIIKVADPIEACEGLTGHYNDRIVLAIRGTCEFCKKAKAAQAAGARAIMVANNDESLIHMTVGTCGGDVEIPSIMVPHSVGEELQHVKYKASTISFPVCRSGSPVKTGFGMEECDDGNTLDGDGCSQACSCEGKCLTTTTSASAPTTSTTTHATTTSITTPQPSTSTTAEAPSTSRSTPLGTTTSSMPSTTSTGAILTGQTSSPLQSATTTQGSLTTSEGGGNGRSTTGAAGSVSSANTSAVATTIWSSVHTTPQPSSTPNHVEAELKSTVAAMITTSGVTAMGLTDETPTPTPGDSEANHALQDPASMLENIQDSVLLIDLTVDLPMTVAEFHSEARAKFRTALAGAAGVSLEQVHIILIQAAERRLLPSSIKVRSAIEVVDEEAARLTITKLTEGSINSLLVDQGLPAATAVGTPNVMMSDDIKCERFSTCKDFGTFVLVHLKRGSELALGLGAGIAVLLMCLLALACFKFRARAPKNAGKRMVPEKSGSESEGESELPEDALCTLYWTQKAVEWWRYTRVSLTLGAWKQAAQASRIQKAKLLKFNALMTSTRLPAVEESATPAAEERATPYLQDTIPVPSQFEAYLKKIEDNNRQHHTYLANFRRRLEASSGADAGSKQLLEKETLRLREHVESVSRDLVSCVDTARVIHLKDREMRDEQTRMSVCAKAMPVSDASQHLQPTLNIKDVVSMTPVWGDLTCFCGDSSSVELDSGSSCVAHFKAFCTLRSGECCPKGARAYYEVEILDQVSAPQFGFVSGGFERVEHFSQIGVGDDNKGWAMDGSRQTPWHNGALGGYTCKWRTNDVVGLACDLTKGQISVSLNGNFECPNGVAFMLNEQDIQHGIYAALSAEKGRIRYNLGHSPFRFCPPWAEKSSGSDEAVRGQVRHGAEETNASHLTDRHIHQRMRRAYGWPQNMAEVSKRLSLKQPQLLQHATTNSVLEQEEQQHVKKTMPTVLKELPETAASNPPTSTIALEQAALAVHRARDASREASTPALPHQVHSQQQLDRSKDFSRRGASKGAVAQGTSEEALERSGDMSLVSPLLQSTSDKSATWHQPPRLYIPANTPPSSLHPQPFEPQNLTSPLKSSILDAIRGDTPEAVRQCTMDGLSMRSRQASTSRSTSSPASCAILFAEEKMSAAPEEATSHLELSQTSSRHQKSTGLSPPPSYDSPRAAQVDLEQVSPIIIHADDFESFLENWPDVAADDDAEVRSFVSALGLMQTSDGCPRKEALGTLLGVAGKKARDGGERDSRQGVISGLEDVEMDLMDDLEQQDAAPGWLDKDPWDRASQSSHGGKESGRDWKGSGKGVRQSPQTVMSRRKGKGTSNVVSGKERELASRQERDAGKNRRVRESATLDQACSSQAVEYSIARESNVRDGALVQPHRSAVGRAPRGDRSRPALLSAATPPSLLAVSNASDGVVQGVPMREGGTSVQLGSRVSELSLETLTPGAPGLALDWNPSK